MTALRKAPKEIIMTRAPAKTTKAALGVVSPLQKKRSPAAPATPASPLASPVVLEPTKTPVAKAKAPAPIRPTLGFGVPATTDPHHFVVGIPKANNGSVQIIESLGLEAKDHQTGVIERVVIDRIRWNAIRSEVQRAFNVRLKEHSLKSSSWKTGVNMVDRLLGRELCVLAWAVEGMDEANLGIAVRNWLALTPEERWWLFGMTATATGGLSDGGKGWRLALRHALGDVAQSEMFKPQEVKKRSKYDPDRPTLDLFN